MFADEITKPIAEEYVVYVTDVRIDDPNYGYPYLTCVDRIGRVITPVRILQNANGVITVPAIHDIIKIVRRGFISETYGQKLPFKEDYIGLIAGDTKIFAENNIYLTAEKGEVYLDGNPIARSYQLSGGVNLLKNSSFDFYSIENEPYYWEIIGDYSLSSEESYKGKYAVLKTLSKSASEISLTSDIIADSSSEDMVFSCFIKEGIWGGKLGSYLRVLNSSQSASDFEVTSEIEFALMDRVIYSNGWSRYWTAFSIPSDSLDTKIEIDLTQGFNYQDTFMFKNDYYWNFTGSPAYDNGLILTNSKAINNFSIGGSELGWSIESTVTFNDVIDGGVLFDYIDKDNYGAIHLDDTSVYFRRVVNGVADDKYSGSHSFNVLDEINIRVDAIPVLNVNSYSVYLNGSLKLNIPALENLSQIDVGVFGCYTGRSTAKFTDLSIMLTTEMVIDKTQVEKGLVPTGWEASTYELIPPGTINIDNLDTEIILGWQFDGVFSSSDYNTVAWTSGTITYSSGLQYSISSGNTGNMSTIMYIYFDSTISSIALQTTIVPSNAVGEHKILIAVAQNVSDVSKKATFQVFGGTGGVGNVVTTDQIAALAITTAEVAADAITTAKIAEDAITAAEIATGAIGTTELAALAVTSAKSNLALRGWTQTCVFTVTDADTITWGAGVFTASDGTSYNIATGSTGNMTVKTYIYLDIAVSTTAYQITTTATTAIGDGKVLVGIAQNGTTEANFMLLNNNSYNIDGANIVAGSITANEILAATITAAKIAANTITAAEIASGAITADELAANAVTAGKIAALTIVAADIAAGTITGAKIAATTITAANIAALTITAANIAALTITGAKIAANTITASNIAADTITANEIAVNTITAGEIAAGTITATQILSHTITALQIAANSISASEIVAHTITALQIAANSISASEIMTGTITANELAVGAVTADDITTGRLASSDGKTFFNLDNDQIIINDGVNDRVLIGLF